MDGLVTMEVVGSEQEAELVCSILRDAGIVCMHRITNSASGAMDGWAVAGPRAVVVRVADLDAARRALANQRGAPDALG